MKITDLLNFWGHLWKKLATHNAIHESPRLKKRLEKFCLPDTPADVRKKGERWGNGQILITRNAEIWRGQINTEWFKDNPLVEWITPTDDGAIVKLELIWFAQRLVMSTLGKRDRPRVIWVRDSLSHPYSLKIKVAEFYQNKGGKRILSPLFIPRRLFFTTTDREQGFFTRDNDPENLELRAQGLYDPTVAKIKKK